METTLTFHFTLTVNKTVHVFIGHVGRWSGREINVSQAERLGRSCLSISCSTLSLARSAQAERDNESCFFVRAADVHRFIRCQNYSRLGRIHMNKTYVTNTEWKSNFANFLERKYRCENGAVRQTIILLYYSGVLCVCWCRRNLAGVAKVFSHESHL